MMVLMILMNKVIQMQALSHFLIDNNKKTMEKVDKKNCFVFRPSKLF